jgi:hypothetical protein
VVAWPGDLVVEVGRCSRCDRPVSRIVRERAREAQTKKLLRTALAWET